MTCTSTCYGNLGRLLSALCSDLMTGTSILRMQACWSLFAWKHWRLAAAAGGTTAGPAVALHYELVPQQTHGDAFDSEED